MPLTSEQLAHYREVLMDKREALSGQVQSLDEVATRSTEATEASRSPLNEADNASDVFEQDLAIMSIESEEDLLNKIEEALKRMKDGAYGQCAECGEEISTERLDALPFATRCVRCQNEAEENGDDRGVDDDAFDVLDEEEVARTGANEDQT